MKIQIKSIFGNLIFEYECENNTIKKTVEEAISKNISLRSADLRGADLRCTNLYGANLRCADLYGAYLYGANLYGADLRCAYLYGANLYGADLRCADLRYTNLYGAYLSDANLYGADLPMYCKWTHSIVDNKVKIGCELKTIEEWDLFFQSDQVYETQRNTQEFKQIEAVYLAYKAYLTHLNK